MTEREIINSMYAYIKEGEKARDDGTVNPHRANTIEYFCHVQGWLKRDLQLALCKANPEYKKTQLACGNVVDAQIGA